MENLKKRSMRLRVSKVISSCNFHFRRYLHVIMKFQSKIYRGHGFVDNYHEKVKTFADFGPGRKRMAACHLNSCPVLMAPVERKGKLKIR